MFCDKTKIGLYLIYTLTSQCIIFTDVFKFSSGLKQNLMYQHGTNEVYFMFHTNFILS